MVYPSTDETVEAVRGYIVPNQLGAICPEGTVDTENLLGGTPGGFRMIPDGVENVSIEDVDGDGPFAGARPKGGGGGIADDWEVLSVIGESGVLRIDPTTDSVCEGVEMGRGGGIGPMGSEGCTIGWGSYGKWHAYGLPSGVGVGEGDGSDAVG